MYEDKTPEAIKAEILAAIRQSQGLSAMAGGFADGVAGPVAEQLSEAYRALEGVTSMLFVDESSGGYIDLVGGQYYNITRREGTRAYCDISFSGTPGLVIPQGHRVSDRRGAGLFPPGGGHAGERTARERAAWRPQRRAAPTTWRPGPSTGCTST